MSSGPQFLDIIILFIIAVLLISRLRSVLGTKSDDDNADAKNNFLKKQNCCSIFDEPQEDNIIDITEKKEKKVEINPIIAKIAAKDNDFDEQEFTNGAKIAFEMIIKSYADNDVDVLKNLLADDVLESFVKAIKERRDNNQTMECQLIGFNNAEIIAADLVDDIAKVTVKFESEQINIVKDSEGNVVAGDPNYVESITDIWTFTRDITSNNPNWKLSATRSS